MSIYAVNGKEPIAAWIPSLDTAGNGTTTLTDLTGNGYDGTLTDMDEETDWVDDGGGLWSLDFDGINDYVNIGSSLQDEFHEATAATFSAWVKKTGSHIAMGFDGTSGNRAQFQWFNDDRIYLTFEGGGGASYPYSAANTSTAWLHIVCVYDGSLTNFDRVSLFVDGVEVSLINAGLFPGTTLSSSLSNFRIGIDDAERKSEGRFDDVRLWLGEALIQTDIDYLYNSGDGRGRVADINDLNPSLLSAIPGV